MGYQKISSFLPKKNKIEEKCAYSGVCSSKINNYATDDCIYFTFMKKAGVLTCPYTPKSFKNYSCRCASEQTSVLLKVNGIPQLKQYLKISAEKIRGNNSKLLIIDDIQFNKPKDTYTFRGKTIIEKVIFDCIKDKKNAFIIIEKEKAYFGISRLVMLRTDHENHYKNNSLLHTFIETSSYAPFYVYEIKKEQILEAIKFLEKEVELINGIEKLLLKKMRKQNKEYDKKGIKRETVQVKVF